MCGRAAKYRTAIAPIGVAFALVLWLGNAAYLYLSVSFIQMIKALMPMAVCTQALLCSSFYLSHTHPPIRTYHTYMLQALIGKVGLYTGDIKWQSVHASAYHHIQAAAILVGEIAMALG